MRRTIVQTCAQTASETTIQGAAPGRHAPPRLAQRQASQIGRPASLTHWTAGLAGALLLLGMVTFRSPATAQSAPEAAALSSTVVDARDAARRRDKPRLAAARAALAAAQHPLALWADYWDLSGRLTEASADEVEAFYARWPGSYVEDRLRNDWLLELGRRRDFARLAREYPRFRMNDDREVTCWALLAEHLAGRDVSDAARSAWLAQREPDEGCNMLATAMVDAKRFSADDVWRKARLAVEAQRPAVAKAAIGLLNPANQMLAKDAIEAMDNPGRFLKRSGGITRNAHEMRLLALLRLAASDLDAAVQQLDGNTLALPRLQAAIAWSYVARQAAFKLLPEASNHLQRAWQLLPAAAQPAAQGGAGNSSAFSDDSLAWGVRALLRSPPSASRWAMVLRQIDAMSATEQRDPAWQYWKAQSLKAGAGSDVSGATPADVGTAASTTEAARAEARRLFEGLAGNGAALGFYPSLAAEELGLKAALPAAPPALSAAERDAAQRTPGLARALLLASLGLRDEARREWNYTLRGMSDRELNAAARLACDANDWQLCINTAERSKTEIELTLRYPMPYAAEITQAAKDAALEPAFAFGIIRQETRFMAQLKSHAGAAGLMQVMPATGRWMAKKLGLEAARVEAGLVDPATNLMLGTRYLKLVLDDLGGSQAMAAAGYNAGPGRPRRWRETGVVEAAAWVESIPFNETRDYVKKVLSNSAVYSALLDSRKAPALRPRLGASIGPRDASAPPAAPDLP